MRNESGKLKNATSRLRAGWNEAVQRQADHNATRSARHDKRRKDTQPTSMLDLALLKLSPLHGARVAVGRVAARLAVPMILTKLAPDLAGSSDPSQPAEPQVH